MIITYTERLSVRIERRRTAFVDTAGWIALLNQKDALHAQAASLRDTLRRQGAILITTEFVLIEVADAFAAPPLRAVAVAFREGLLRQDTAYAVEIVQVSEDLLGRGWALYGQRADKDWGLTDCTSFVVMQERQIAEAFTSDRHFEQAGFTRLL